MSAIVNNILIILILAIIYNSDFYTKNYHSVIEDYFFSPKELNPDFKTAEVITVKEAEEKQYLNKF